MMPSAPKQATRAAVVAAQAVVDKAQLDLGFTKVTSPIDGIAGIAKAQIGNLVGPGSIEELTTVSTVDPIKVYIPMSEQEYLNYVQNGREHGQQMPLELILADGNVHPHAGLLCLCRPPGGRKDRHDQGGRPLPQSGKRAPTGTIRQGPSADHDQERRASGAPAGGHGASGQGTRWQWSVPTTRSRSGRSRVAERVDNLWVIDEGLKPGEGVVAEGLQKVKEGTVVTTKPFALNSVSEPEVKSGQLGGHSKARTLAGAGQNRRKKVGGQAAMSKFFINRPIVAMVISIMFVILGLVAMVGLPVAQFPEIVPPEIQIFTTYTGADAETVEQSVATPIEQQMSGVDNMNYMYSVNASNGTMRMFVNFDVKTDPNTDLIFTQMRQNQAQAQLPARRAQLRRDDPEIESRPADARRPALPQGDLRWNIPGELRQYQPHRPARCACPGVGPGGRLWGRPVRDPHLGQTGHPGQTRHHRSRYRECRPEAECRQSGRTDRQRAGASRARNSPTRSAPRVALSLRKSSAPSLYARIPTGRSSG